MAEDALHEQRVDVAAGEHGDDGPPEGLRVAEQGGDRAGTRRFDDQFGPFQAEQQGAGEFVLGDRADLVDQLLDQAERYVAGAADLDAVGHRVRRRLQGDRVPGGQRGRVRGGARRLHADDPHVGAQRLDRDGDARREPAPADADDDGAYLGALFEDLQADGALARDDVRVVEGVDEDRPGPFRVLLGGGERLVDDLAVQPDLGPVLAGRRDLGEGAPTGMKTVERTPSSEEASATPCAWFPALAATTPAGPFLRRGRRCARRRRAV